MDLNDEILKSMSLNPREMADRNIRQRLGAQWTVTARPHLNPTPEQQVALQQVGHHSKQVQPTVQPAQKYRALPDKQWVFTGRNEEYILACEDGAYTVKHSRMKRSFFGLIKHRETRVMRSVGTTKELMTWLDDAPIPINAVEYFQRQAVAHAGAPERMRQTVSPVLGARMQAMHTDDYMPQVTPTGRVEEGHFGSDYEWGLSLDALPDLFPQD